jgi:hypothetical protein
VQDTRRNKKKCSDHGQEKSLRSEQKKRLRKMPGSRKKKAWPPAMQNKRFMPTFYRPPFQPADYE